MTALVFFAWAAGAVTLGGILRFSYRIARKVDDAFEFLEELKENGGTSIKDTVNRIDTKLDLHFADPHAHTVLGTPPPPRGDAS